MHHFLSDDELRRYEELAAKATPGPWTASGSCVRTGGSKEGPYSIGSTGSNVYAPVSDCQFIAAAREAVPKLCAEVRRLRSSVSPPGAITSEEYQAVYHELPDVRAERDRLRKILDACHEAIGTGPAGEYGTLAEGISKLKEEADWGLEQEIKHLESVTENMPKWHAIKAERDRLRKLCGEVAKELWEGIPSMCLVEGTEAAIHRLQAAAKGEQA